MQVDNRKLGNENMNFVWGILKFPNRSSIALIVENFSQWVKDEAMLHGGRKPTDRKLLFLEKKQ